MSRPILNVQPAGIPLRALNMSFNSKSGVFNGLNGIHQLAIEICDVRATLL
jgi:ABC-type uncharacterized transport system permease subunit